MGGRITLPTTSALTKRDASTSAIPAVYRLDPNGSVYRVVIDCGKCNGVLVSPDQRTLYVIGNDNGWFDLQTTQEGAKPLQGAHQLQAYDLSPNAETSNRRL